MRPPSHAARVFAFALPLLAGACTPPAGQNDGGYKVVRLHYDYGLSDQRSQEWNSQSAALDQCHRSGFTSAQAAAAPVTTCTSRTSDACTRWHAAIAYDCVGMGWQDN